LIKQPNESMSIMEKKLLLATIAMVAVLNAAGIANAQVAGSSTSVGVSVTEVTEITKGWSAKKGILGKTVYNDAGVKVGKVEDLIVSTDKKVTYLIVGVGGFVGIGRHDVAIPFTQIREEGGKIILPGATKDAVKAMPRFDYATDTTQRDQFLARADQDIAKAKEKMAEAEKKAASAMGDAKAKLDQQITVAHQDMKAAEDKLGEMKRADEKKWKEFEADVAKAIARVKLSIDRAVG